MRFDHPGAGEIAQLFPLWKAVFGDYGGFWEMFLDTAFLPDHCLCLLEDNQVTAALYWFDCECADQKLAYVYGVVTHPEYRNRGLCRALLEQTHAHLKGKGYAAVLLVPAEAPLRQMYEKLGYETCTCVSEFSCTASEQPISIRAIGPEEYRMLRREYLPEGSVLQEGANLDFLAAQAQFYVGDNILLAAYQEENCLHGMELLGCREAAPGILRALSCEKGHFRTPGGELPFAMIHPLVPNAPVPKYFGFAFD